MKTQDGDMYLLQDGTYAAAGDCKADDKGVMRHANGLAVAMRDDGEPETLMSGAVHNYNMAAAAMVDPDVASVTEVQEKILSEDQPASTEDQPAPGARTAARQPAAPVAAKPAEEPKSAPLTKATLP